MKKRFIRKSVSLLVLGALCLPMAVSARSIIDEEDAEYKNRSLRYARQRNEIVNAIVGEEYDRNEAERTSLTSDLTAEVVSIIAERDEKRKVIEDKRVDLEERRTQLLNTGDFRTSGREEYRTINERIEELEKDVLSLIQATTERLIPLNDEINELSADVNARQRELNEESTRLTEDFTDSQILGEVGLLSTGEVVLLREAGLLREVDPLSMPEHEGAGRS